MMLPHVQALLTSFVARCSLRHTKIKINPHLINVRFDLISQKVINDDSKIIFSPDREKCRVRPFQLPPDARQVNRGVVG